MKLYDEKKIPLIKKYFTNYHKGEDYHISPNTSCQCFVREETLSILSNNKRTIIPYTNYIRFQTLNVTVCVPDFHSIRDS